MDCYNDEPALEVSRTFRELLERACRKIAARQLGEDFVDLSVEESAQEAA